MKWQEIALKISFAKAGLLCELASQLGNTRAPTEPPRL